jgi:hypothetical protein
MNWARFVLIVIATGVVSSLTDWFFAGDWIVSGHEPLLRQPLPKASILLQRDPPLTSVAVGPHRNSDPAPRRKAHRSFKDSPVFISHCRCPSACLNCSSMID